MHHVDRTAFEPLAEAPAGHVAFTGGDPDVGERLAERDQAVGGVHVDWLFDEQHPDLVAETLGQPMRGLEAEDATAVDHQFDIRPTRLTDFVGHGQGHVDLFFIVVGFDVLSGSKLERIESLGSGRSHLLALGRQAQVASGVQTDSIADRPAEQLVDRLAGDFAQDVPQGLVDAAGGAGGHHAIPPPVKPSHLLPDVVDPCWVLPDQQVGQVALDHRHHRQLVVLGRCLSDSHHSLVGLDLDEDPVAGRGMASGSGDAHQMCGQAGDFHEVVSSGNSGVVGSVVGGISDRIGFRRS